MWGLLLGTALVIPLLPQEAPRPGAQRSVPMQNEATNEVLKADDARRDATVQNDVAALDAIYTNDFTYTHSSGFREGKHAYLDRIRNGEVRYIGLDRLQADVRIYGDVAIVDGTASMRFQRSTDAAPQLLDSLYLGVWIKAGAQWQMLSYASTSVGG